MADQWYFAYGSNLSIERKEERTGRIRQALPCRLPGYRFAFNKRQGEGPIYANIVTDDAAEVWGVIYLCDSVAMLKLDEKEGVATGHYEQVRVTVEKESDETVEAVAYVARNTCICNPGRPADYYLEKIISGARHHGLPEDYIKGIETLAKQHDDSVSRNP